MRRFLRRHSGLYRWATRELEFDLTLAARRAEVLEEHRLREKRDMEIKAQDDLDRLDANHRQRIAELSQANEDLRLANRELVAHLRERGEVAAEFPATRCPHCGSFAAMPEDGKHAMGVIRRDGQTFRLFCDGTES